MAVLITGGTGFLGSSLARRLRDRGEEVKILLRSTSRTENIDDIDVNKVYGDILDRDSIKKALEGCDTLYHVAGLISTKKADSRRMEEINIDGTVNVLDAALDAGLDKVVYTSTIGAIGTDPGGGVGNEETEYNLEYLGVNYLNSKYKSELEALKFVEKGLPLVVVNPAMVTGPGDIYFASTGGFILWYCLGKIPGYLNGGGNFIDIEDVAEGHILAAEKGRVGERYILGNKNMSMKEILSLLEEITGIPAPKIKVPYFMALTVGFIHESILKTDAPSFLVRDVDSAKVLSLNLYYDSSKAVRELGLPQTPVEKSIERTIEWLRENNHI